MRQPVFHLNFPSVDLASPIREQLFATIEVETKDWPADLAGYAKTLVGPLSALISATAGTSGKAIVLVSGNMTGQIQYVVSKFA